MPKVIALLLLLAFVVPLRAQLLTEQWQKARPQKLWRASKMSLQLGDTYGAVALLELMVGKAPEHHRARYALAEAHLANRNYQGAADHLTELLNQQPEAYPLAWFDLGRSLKSLGRTAEARRAFETFSAHVKRVENKTAYRKLLKAEMAGLAVADSLLANPLKAEVEPLSIVNGAYSEGGLWATDSVLLFSRMAHEGLVTYTDTSAFEALPRVKIYSTEFADGSWQPAHPLESEIEEGPYHVSNAAIDPTGRKLYYTRCAEAVPGQLKCELFVAERVNGKWKNSERLGDGINARGASATQAAVGLDPKKGRTILYFVSDREGGRGGTDIWWSQYNKRDDEWSAPRNAGSQINTPGDEQTPWIDLKEGTIYFSSNGHPGLGGMDVFSAVGEKSKWSAVQVLGIPINSPADDVFFRKQPRERYQLVVSNRAGSQSPLSGFCCDDVYEVFYPENMHLIAAVDVKAAVGSQLTMSPSAPATIAVYKLDPSTGETYLLTTDTMGSSFKKLQLPPGGLYQFELSQPGFFTALQQHDTRGMKAGNTTSVVLEQKPWTGNSFTLPDIQFEFNSAEITREGGAVIENTLLKVLRENPSLRIEIGAHTDNKGTAEYNQKLSQRRAESIVKYLKQRGIDDSRLLPVGYGESVPVTANENADGSDNEAGRAANRRVEFKVIGTVIEVDELAD